MYKYLHNNKLTLNKYYEFKKKLTEVQVSKGIKSKIWFDERPILLSTVQKCVMMLSILKSYNT